MDLIIDTPTTARWGKQKFRCAIGAGGAVHPINKREGDKRTPAGRWLMREVFYRTDRVMEPITKLPTRILHPKDGWCENPSDVNYNKLVQNPYRVPVDNLWRDEAIYDLFVPLGYNDDPVVAGMGSAIFLHVARPDYAPSAGCITLKKADLIKVLKEADPTSAVDITIPVMEVEPVPDPTEYTVKDIDWETILASVD